MSNWAPFAIIPVVCIAGALALYGVERAPDATAAPRPSVASPESLAPVGEMEPSEMGETLPPNHPPIGAGASPHGAMPSMGAGASPHGTMPMAVSEAPALLWTVPTGWSEAANPNSMRLATYHAPGDVEVSVSRAGGETEANIQRWIGQFDDTGREWGRAEKTVHGLHVVTVDITGTYVGGGMNMGGPSEPKPNSTMIGAVVESRSPSYFFKMTGPAAAVHAARPAFDRLIDGITPT